MKRVKQRSLKYKDGGARFQVQNIKNSGIWEENIYSERQNILLFTIKIAKNSEFLCKAVDIKGEKGILH